MAEPTTHLMTEDPVAGLIDIPLPQPVSLWPQTWEARLAIAVATAGLVAGICLLLRSWHANRYRRAALVELDVIARRSATTPGEAVEALALLVRRTALGVFPRSTIAPLAGDAWLRFLDASYGDTGFASGPGCVLGLPVYSQHRPPPAQLGALTDLVRRWIRTHHV
jgi:Domain of unknown function (DUF4381)